MGFEEAAQQVQDLYLARQHRDAAAAVPLELIDQTALIGPRDRIKDRLARYAEAGVTTLSVSPYAASLPERLHVLRTLGDLMEETGLRD
jgi:alkanesulfonate monooxygenase SsuD/methylene tetrahydromethanopterin reductase-like flavin-dependent oxidoreductase (luciferase family)